MKKLFKLFLAIIITVIFLFPTQSFAVYNPDSTVYQSDNSRVTGLIISYNIGISRSGTTLTIAGKMSCHPDVVKCGFKEIVVQRRAVGTSTWSNYVTYEDLYEEDDSILVTKTLTASSSYQYRATCVYYAKKSLLLTQNLDGVSNIV